MLLMARRRVLLRRDAEPELHLPPVNSGSGAILEMLSDQIYRVDDADQADSSIWLATVPNRVASTSSALSSLLTEERNQGRL
jgi:hypothetical protein